MKRPPPTLVESLEYIAARSRMAREHGRAFKPCDDCDHSGCVAQRAVIAHRADPKMVSREDVAAYLLDRADQYDTSSGSWVGLADAAKGVISGEVEAAVAHDELDEALRARVRSMAKEPA